MQRGKSNIYTISIQNISSYLLNTRLVNHKSVVDNNLKIIDVSRKNKIIKVMQENSQNYILKQSNISDYFSMETIRREAKFYSTVQKNNRFAYLQEIIPFFVKFDTPNNILITEFIKDSQVLSNAKYHVNRNIDFLFLLGKTLAKFHNSSTKLINDHSLKFLPRVFPPILFISQPKPEIFTILSPAGMSLIKIIQQDRILNDLLTAIRDEWQIHTLIHGDVKLDNVLVSHGSKQNNDHLKIIDWELVDMGDPAWDVGTVFYNFLYDGYSELFLKIDPSNTKLMLKKIIKHVNNKIFEFWMGYATTVKLKAFATDHFFQKSLRFGLSRLLQTAFDSLSKYRDIPDYNMGIIDVTREVLRNFDSVTDQFLNVSTTR